jgi:hypothetical protein
MGRKNETEKKKYEARRNEDEEKTSNRCKIVHTVRRTKTRTPEMQRRNAAAGQDVEKTR